MHLPEGDGPRCTTSVRGNSLKQWGMVGRPGPSPPLAEVTREVRSGYDSLVPGFRSSPHSAATETNFENQNGTSKHMILVPFFDLKFLGRVCRK